MTRKLKDRLPSSPNPNLGLANIAIPFNLTQAITNLYSLTMVGGWDATRGVFHDMVRLSGGVYAAVRMVIVDGMSHDRLNPVSEIDLCPVFLSVPWNLGHC